MLFVDVGGTKTRIDDGTRRVLFPTDFDKLPAKLKSFARGRQLIVGMKGAWLASEKLRWQKKLSRVSKNVIVVSDIELAHSRLFGNKGAGILLTGGTGSIAYGRNAKGKTARVGGLGALLGDEGSGFWIGKTWLKLEFEERGDWKTVRAYAKQPDAVRAIAGCARGVLERAQKNPKSLERKIALNAALCLGRLVWQVRRELKLGTAAPLGFAGGLFENEWFKKEVLKRCY